MLDASQPGGAQILSLLVGVKNLRLDRKQKQEPGAKYPLGVSFHGCSNGLTLPQYE